jgi:MYXO-CTERM domain-containing protein
MTDSGGYCSQDCIIGVKDSCPANFECVAAGASGACLPADAGGGCCSVGGPDAVWAHAGISLFVLALLVRGRRRRRNRL